jgi:hypothetical protein
MTFLIAFHNVTLAIFDRFAAIVTCVLEGVADPWSYRVDLGTVGKIIYARLPNSGL